MKIEIELNELIAILLNGDWFGSVAIPSNVGESLLPYQDKGLHLEKDCDGAGFYTLYSIEGWQNELRRRDYIVSVSKAHKQQEEKPSLESLKKRTADLIAEGRFIEASAVANQIQQLYGQ